MLLRYGDHEKTLSGGELLTTNNRMELMAAIEAITLGVPILVADNSGLAELARLGVALGGEPLTFAGLAGMGDLIATCASPYSRNHWIGVELGRGAKLGDLLEHLETLKETAEGINTIRAGRELAAQQRLRMPLAECVYAVALEGAEPRSAFERLLGDASATAPLAAG